EPLLKLGQAGAFIPLTSFGNSLFEGALEGIEKSGFLGAFTGVFKETSLGLSFAVFMGWLISLIFNPKG
ncbi:MAG: SpoVA/SpoVAEb family sporulation membrane protein, partial [bacterium]